MPLVAVEEPLFGNCSDRSHKCEGKGSCRVAHKALQVSMPECVYEEGWGQEGRITQYHIWADSAICKHS